MKAESNSLIYIIISIALLIISTIGKNKAKKEAPRHEQEEESIPQTQWPRDLEDIFGKMDDTDQPKPETTREHWLDKEPELAPEPEIVQMVQPVEFTPTEQNNQTETNGSLSVYEENEPQYAFAFDHEDMRKAVIYSEILNRKYI